MASQATFVAEAHLPTASSASLCPSQTSSTASFSAQLPLPSASLRSRHRLPHPFLPSAASPPQPATSPVTLSTSRHHIPPFLQLYHQCSLNRSCYRGSSRPNNLQQLLFPFQSLSISIIAVSSCPSILKKAEDRTARLTSIKALEPSLWFLSMTRSAMQRTASYLQELTGRGGGGGGLGAGARCVGEGYTVTRLVAEVGVKSREEGRRMRKEGGSGGTWNGKRGRRGSYR